MTAPKPSAHTAAQLRVLFGANPCQNPGHADPPCTWNQRAAQLDDLLAAARAEAVAPVLEVLRELVAAMPRCTAGACGDAACEGCDVMCGRTATRGIVCDEHGEGEPDSDYAAPLRLALALLGAEP